MATDTTPNHLFYNHPPPHSAVSTVSSLTLALALAFALASISKEDIQLLSQSYWMDPGEWSVALAIKILFLPEEPW